MEVILYPLEKIEINELEVTLGMEHTTVDQLLGKGKQARREPKRYYYYHGEMAIDYDNNDRIEFIEFLGGSLLQPIIYGVSVFEVNGDELVTLLKEHNGDDIDDSENGYSLSFMNISVGLYRSSTPTDLKEMLVEMQHNGISLNQNPNLEVDIFKANHWETIGMGVAAYYR